MIVMFYVVAGLLALGLAAAVFLRMDATRMAGALRIAGPAAMGIVGLGLLLIGRIGIGGMLLSGAAAWFTSSRARGMFKPSPGKRSTVRTAALEMELDHDSGALTGVVLAGRHEGRNLDELDQRELIELGAELTSDAESLQLLETYLDGRFPLWREDANAESGQRQARAPASGAMTEEEAYQLLGVDPGASAAEIRKAHRRLMQRVHPDLGGSSFLAARINEAKDVLLSRHS